MGHKTSKECVKVCDKDKECIKTCKTHPECVRVCNTDKECIKICKQHPEYIYSCDDSDCIKNLEKNKVVTKECKNMKGKKLDECLKKRKENIKKTNTGKSQDPRLAKFPRDIMNKIREVQTLYPSILDVMSRSCLDNGNYIENNICMKELNGLNQLHEKQVGESLKAENTPLKFRKARVKTKKSVRKSKRKSKKKSKSKYRQKSKRKSKKKSR